MKQPITPLMVINLFPEMRHELLRILRSLPDEAWSRPSLCPGWTVRDVVRHLLADDIGYLSRNRDQDGLYFPTQNWEDLVQKINQQNEAWVTATRPISRKLLLSLLEFTGEQVYDYLSSLDMNQMTSPIGWAENVPAPMWLEVARELTENWMHHQHICESAGVISLKNQRFLRPVLTTFAHALPKTYQDVLALDQTTLQVHITGDVEQTWYLIRENTRWVLYADTDQEPASVITLNSDTAWRIFTKGIARRDAQQQIRVEGDQTLGMIFLNTVAIIA